MLLTKGDTKKAIEALERLDQTYPDSPLIKYDLARAYVKNNNMNQAAVALDQAVSLNPNSGAGADQLAACRPIDSRRQVGIDAARCGGTGAREQHGHRGVAL